MQKPQLYMPETTSKILTINFVFPKLQRMQFKKLPEIIDIGILRNYLYIIAGNFHILTTGDLSFILKFVRKIL